MTHSDFYFFVVGLLGHIRCNVLGVNFYIRISEDQERLTDPDARLFIQIYYTCPDSREPSKKQEAWRGRKVYLSRWMTEDEIVKQVYVAFEAAVKHEIMEGFTFDNVVVFNPHVNFRELLKISHLEVTRNPVPPTYSEHDHE